MGLSKWKFMALVQKGISFLPERNRVDAWFKKNVLDAQEFTDKYFADELEQALNHLDYFHKFSETNLDESNVYELATGRFPVLPIFLFLNKVKWVYTVDEVSLLNCEELYATCDKYIQWHKAGKLSQYIPNVDEADIKLLEKLVFKADPRLDVACRKIRITQWIGNAELTCFNHSTMDFICSNSILAHVPKSELGSIMQEFKRLLKPNGLMSHYIDMSDQYSDFDTSINKYNFLQYSDENWGLFDNEIQTQNRLRLPDFKRLFGQLKFNILHEVMSEGNLQELGEINLAKQYQSIPVEELAVSHVHFVSKMN